MTQLLYVIAMVAVIVGVDVLFFRNLFWERLLVNVGIVMVFAAFYLMFLNERSRRSPTVRHRPRRIGSVRWRAKKRAAAA